MTAKSITRFLHSKTFARLALSACVGATVVAWQLGDVPPITGDRGPGMASPNLWLAGHQALSLAVNLVLVCGALLLMEFTVKLFNVLRSMTELPWAAAALMLMATPSLSGQLYGGTVLCAVMWGLTAVMFSTFGAADGMQRRVFLIFFVLSLAGLCQYAFLLYVPMMLTATVQMRIFSLRTLLAALIGMVTPLWIVLGFGLLDIDDLTLPAFGSVFGIFDTDDTVPTLTAFGMTAAVSLVGIGMNFVKFIAYNARTRGFNGMLILMTVWTLLLMCLDLANAIIYQPLLTTLAGIQLGHYFANHRGGRTYIIILLILSLFIAVYVWNIVK